MKRTAAVKQIELQPLHLEATPRPFDAPEVKNVTDVEGFLFDMNEADDRDLVRDVLATGVQFNIADAIADVVNEFEITEGELLQ